MGGLNSKFEAAHKTSLNGFHMLSPIADTENSMIAFASSVTGEEGILKYELFKISPEDMDAYDGVANIHFSYLTPTGVQQARYEAVWGAIQKLPNTMVEKLNIGTDDATALVSLMNGNISGDTIDLLIEDGELLGFLKDYSVIVNNEDERGTVELDQETAKKLAPKIDKAILKLEQAKDLPGFHSALKDTLENSDGAKKMISAEQRTELLALLNEDSSGVAANASLKVRND